MMSSSLLFRFICLLATCLSKNTDAFAYASTGLEATRPRGDTGGIKGRRPYRIPQPVGAEKSSSSVADLDDNSNDIDTDSANPSVNNIFFDVLQDAIHLNSTEASSLLLSKITEMRQSGEYTKEYQENFLNNLLALGPDARLPIWSRVRPLARFSRRARMRSLRRTLDQITPTDTDRKKDSIDSRLQRRRRALVSLLSSLSAKGSSSSENKTESESDERVTKKTKRRPAIVTLEKKAIEASKDSASDLTSRIPEGLETPDYEVIASGKDANNRMATNVEIRRYKPYSVCTVSMAKPRPTESAKTDQKLGSPELGGASSFGALAGYLFGKNDQSTAMKMTTPVFTTNPGEVSSTEKTPVETETGEQEDRQMEFVLPSNYWGKENMSKAPMPLEGSGVTLQERDSEERAVLMFGGYASKKEAEKRKKELLSTLSKRDSKWNPIVNTDSLAQYNDPFTVPWRRLNEVSVKVEGR